SRRDATLRRDAGHFGVHEARAAERTIAVVHEVPVVRHAVGRTVLCHWRDHDTVRESEAAQLEGQEHRRAASAPAVAAGGAAFIALDELRVPYLQILVSDALTAGEETIGELLGRQTGVALDVLEPL